jgi:hypothetical protein
MNVKRPLVVMLAVAMLASVFAVGPVAAQDCTIDQENSQVNALNVNTDVNANALNTAASAPVLSPDADSDATATQAIADSNDDFQSQGNSADC